MTDVSFTNEQAAAGGALFVRGGNVSGVGVTFENNGNGGFDGGAAYVLSGNLSLTNATIVGNGWSSFGGGIAKRRRDRDAGPRHVRQHPRRYPDRSRR